MKDEQNAPSAFLYEDLRLKTPNIKSCTIGWWEKINDSWEWQEKTFYSDNGTYRIKIPLGAHDAMILFDSISVKEIGPVITKKDKVLHNQTQAQKWANKWERRVK
mgnify:CR=1 FL=1